MRAAWDWDEDDILALIRDGVQESITLDYKACDALATTDGKKAEISKDVSAFANSAGGTIVYGVTEDKHLPIAIDSGYDPTQISKEWLEQVINSRIQQRVDGIQIKPVELHQTNPGRVLYVVSIPQSLRAPHMASDHRYYKRFNFESVAMEDYEVRDVSRRGATPDLRLVPYIADDADPPSQYSGNPNAGRVTRLGIYLTNDAPTPAEYLIIDLFLDPGIVVHGADSKFRAETQSWNIEGQRLLLQRLTMNWGIPYQLPVWQGVKLTPMNEPMLIGFGEPYGDFTFGWVIKSPGMPNKGAIYDLRLTRTGVRIIEQADGPPIANISDAADSPSVQR